MRAAPWLLLGVALAHLAFGVHARVSDGALAGFVYDAPWALLTLGAALLLALRLPTGAVVLVSLALGLAVVAVPLYGLGLVHLPQAVVGLLVAVATGRRPADH